MKYFLIAGEASGDFHAARLMEALRREDEAAEFRFFGGDEMAKVGGRLCSHYRDLAYMGFIPVIRHLRTILRGMARCKKEILNWRPDCVILVDYPGFNLKIARFVKSRNLCPVYYYISPKIWAWKERRIKAIRRDVDALFSILPFEVDFFTRRHGYPIHYVGNPTLDEVTDFLVNRPAVKDSPRPARPTIALLPGSRRQEVTDNLSRMLEAIKAFLPDYRVEIVHASALPRELYSEIIQKSGLSCEEVGLYEGGAFSLLSESVAALVTSGTATLETALFRVPQVVCYFMRPPRLVSFLRPYFLKVPFISLVNLVADREVVPELIGAEMNAARLRCCLEEILPGGAKRQAQLEGFELVASQLGSPGAPRKAAQIMVEKLSDKV